MYLAFYELENKPFQITADPNFLWLGDKHKEALATLRYGIMDNRGFLLLTGEVGTGKTILINQLITMLEIGTVVATIPDPDLVTMDFYNLLADGFKMNRTFDSKSAFLIQLRDFLHKSHAEKKQVLLIIDESQRLNHHLMEDIRVLSNIELHDRKLINVFFVGQQEFNNMLMTPQNRALAQRITIRYHIEPLDSSETEKYIQHRLKTAGSKRSLFKRSAFPEIYAFSNGIPRLINIICDRALLTGFSRGQREIDGAMVRECAEELRIPVKKPTEASALPSPAWPSSATAIAASNKPNTSAADSVTVGMLKSDPLPIRPAMNASTWRALLLISILILIALVVFAISRQNQSASARWNRDDLTLQKDLSSLENEKESLTQRLKNGDTDLVPSDSASKDAGNTRLTIAKEEERIESGLAIAANADSKGSLRQMGIRESEIAPLPFLKEKTTIFFSLNSNEIEAKSYDILDRIAAYLKNNPDESINVRGYTDASGSPGYNASVSGFRANAIKSYMLGKGAPPESIRIFAMGSANPLGSNDTAEGRTMNRRVEIEFSTPGTMNP